MADVGDAVTPHAGDDLGGADLRRLGVERREQRDLLACARSRDATSAATVAPLQRPAIRYGPCGCRRRTSPR
jgi:hypothetical protein